MHVDQQATSSLRARKVDKFPRLPIPSLPQTVEAYKRSLLPFLREETRLSGLSIASAIKERSVWAAEFEHGIGKICQARLIELDQKSPYNWLDDNFWLKKVYHESRLPLLIHSNWWLALRPDTGLEQHTLKPVTVGSSYTEGQVLRAAWMIHRFLVVKQNIERNELYPESAAREHWARRPSLAIFNTSRIPRPRCDVFASRPHALEAYARRVVILLNRNIYTLEVVRDDGELHSPGDIYQSLCNIVVDTKEDLQELPLSVLTTSDRDTWAKNREHLASLSTMNKQNLKQIDDSLFAVSLDAMHELPTTTVSANEDTRYDNFLHSIRSGSDGRNRWLDKGFTVIVRPDAEAGMSGEHSPCDALVPSMVADEALAEPIPSNLSGPSLSPPHAEKLKWTVDSHLQKECDKASREAKRLIDDSDDSLLWFRDFGASWLTRAKLAPDAFIQLAFQLAWFRDQGCFTAVYETALTRLFLHGRTETIRSLTNESYEFVLSMQDPECSNERRYSLMFLALEVHNSLTKKAIKGQGIDRHLMGLQLVMQPGETSPLFTDPSFASSQVWRLSTSGLSAGERFIGTGFGSPYDDGYGIAYMAAPEHLRFGIESKHSCPKTSTHRFKSILKTCLLEMQELSISAAPIQTRL